MAARVNRLALPCPALVFPALALAALLALACGGSPNARPQTPGPVVALTFEALDGGNVELTRYRGRIVVLHVFTTWSMGAQRDVPQLIEASRRFDDRVVVLGLSLDPDGHRLVAPWRKVNAIPYLIGLGTRESLARSSLGDVAEVPTTFVFDDQGRVVHRIARPLGDGELLPLLERMTTGR